MNIVQFLASFFYRIRYWLLWGSLLVTALVIYFTQFLPYSYTVNSSLYAGVTNSTNLDGSQLININSTFDNIINRQVQKHFGKGFGTSACNQPRIR